jgi:release factor glutamine methyltransferase
VEGTLNIYPPSEDTFLLEKSIPKIKRDLAIDVGTGSGYLAFFLSEFVKYVIATDIEKNAVKYALNISKKKKVHNVDFVVTNLFDCFRNDIFDLVVFNPPYLPYNGISTEIDIQTIFNLKNRNIIIEFLSKLKNILKRNGECYIVLSSLSPVNEIINFIEAQGLKYEKVCSKRFFFEEIFVLKLSYSP